MPSVTVIIPVYNGEAYLRPAIESVLDQTRAPHEIFVVDDGSTDETGAIAQMFPVTYIKTSHAGSPVAKNIGVENARSEMISFLDADDLWVPDKIECQLKEFDSNPELDAVYGMMEQFHSPELGNSTEPPHKIIPGMYLTLMIRKKAFERIGGFQANRVVTDTVEWCARAQTKNLRIHCLPRVLARRRIHKTNMGIRHRDLRSEYLKFIREKLASANPPKSDAK
jgi:glycosyltransferase involved in cell wall biosynthesis